MSHGARAGIFALLLIADIVVAAIWWHQRAETNPAAALVTERTNPALALAPPTPPNLKKRTPKKKLDDPAPSLHSEAVQAITRDGRDPKLFKKELLDLFVSEQDFTAGKVLLEMGEAKSVIPLITRRGQAYLVRDALMNAGKAAWPTVLAECEFSDILGFLLVCDEITDVPPALLQEAAMRFHYEDAWLKKRGVSPENLLLFQSAMRTDHRRLPLRQDTYQPRFDRCKTLDEFVRLKVEQVAQAVSKIWDSDYAARLADSADRGSLLTRETFTDHVKLLAVADGIQPTIEKLQEILNATERMEDPFAIQAVFGLLNLGPEGHRVVFSAIEGDKANVREAARAGLSRAERLPASIVPELKKRLQDPGVLGRETLTRALLAARDVETFRAVVASPDYKQLFAFDVRRIGNDAVPIVVAAIEKDPKDEARASWAVEVLRGLANDVPAARPALEKLKESLHESVAKALRRPAGFQQAAFGYPPLTEKMIDPDAAKRQFEAEMTPRGKLSCLGPAIRADADLGFADAFIAQTLDGPDRELRAAAANALTAGGPRAASTLARILQRNRSPRLQVAVLYAMKHIGPKAAQEVPAVVGTLNSKNSVVRRSALEALKAFGAESFVARDAFRRALVDPEPANRRLAALGLAEFEEDALPALDGLIALLRDPDSSCQAAAIAAIGKMGNAAKDAIQPLTALLRPSEPNALAAAGVLAKFGPLAESAMPDLLALGSRFGANDTLAYALVDIGRNRIQWLVEHRRDDPSLVGSALKKMGPRVVPEVMKAIRPPKAGASPSAMNDLLWALVMLDHLGPTDTDVLPYLRDVLQTTSDRAAIFAVQVAARNGPRAIPLIRQAMQHPDGQVKAAAIVAIGSVGFPAREMVPDLLQILKRDSGPLRGEAIVAITRLGPAASEAFAEIATTAQQSEEPYPRNVCIEFLERFDLEREERAWAAFRQFEAQTVKTLPK
jgi:HEAT repeat protein